MLRFCAVAVLLVLLAGPGLRAALAGECDSLRATGNAQYPPITWNNAEGEFLGSYVDITRMALDALDIRLVTDDVPRNWARAQAEVKAGNFDLLIGPWFNRERDQWLVYVTPEISLDPAVIFMNADRTFTYQSKEDLRGRVGAMQRANSYGDDFDRFARRSLDIVEVPGWEAAFKLLALGRVDYVPSGLYAGQLTINRLQLDGRIRAAPTPLRTEKMYIALSRQSPCRHLAEPLGAVIARLKADGVVARIMDRYSDFTDLDLPDLNSVQ